MQWYYSKNGIQLGPITGAEIRGKLASGEILVTDLVWRDGMADWLAAEKVDELAIPPVTQSVPPSISQASPYASPKPQPEPLIQQDAHIPNYLWQSIVVTIFCCWPFGVPAIIYAAKVDSLKAQGDISGAMAASASAKTWCMVSVGVILGITILWAIGVGISGLTQD